MHSKLHPIRLAPACLTLACLTACQKPPAQTQAAAGPPPAVVVARVAQETVPVFGEFVGQIQAEASVDLVARVQGVLKEMNFKEGQPVQKDQVLYQIDPVEYQSKVDSAKAVLAKADSALRQSQLQTGVRQAKAELEQQNALLAKSKQDVNRYKPLVAQRAVPQQDLDGALASQQVNQANVDAAQARYENETVNTKAQIDLNTADLASAKASLAQAELSLSYCTIRAPFAGLIGRTKVFPGALVGGGAPALLNTLSTISPVQVTFGIPEAGYLSVRKRSIAAGSTSQPALEAQLILADGSIYPFKGHFKLADSAIDQKTGTLTIVMNFPNEQGLLRPNGFARVRLVTDTAKDALLIPQKAVVEQQGGSAVLIVNEDGKVVQRTVMLGPQVDTLVIVRQGVQKGERIIVEGQQKARPGSSVTAREQALTALSGAR